MDIVPKATMEHRKVLGTTHLLKLDIVYYIHKIHPDLFGTPKCAQATVLPLLDHYPKVSDNISR